MFNHLSLVREALLLFLSQTGEQLTETMGESLLCCGAMDLSSPGYQIGSLLNHTQRNDVALQLRDSITNQKVLNLISTKLNKKGKDVDIFKTLNYAPNRTFCKFSMLLQSFVQGHFFLTTTPACCCKLDFSSFLIGCSRFKTFPSAMTAVGWWSALFEAHPMSSPSTHTEVSPASAPTCRHGL